MSSTIVLPKAAPTIAQTSTAIDWHMVVVTLADGQVAAWMAEWPDCRVEAPSREAAIEALQTLLDERLTTIEVIPIHSTIAVKPAEHPAMKFVGALKDDPDFVAWSDEFWAEKQRSHDDDEILSVEECLRVM